MTPRSHGTTPFELLVAGENQGNDVSAVDSAGIRSSAITGMRACVKPGAAKVFLVSELSRSPSYHEGFQMATILCWHGAFCSAVSSKEVH